MSLTVCILCCACACYAKILCKHCNISHVLQKCMQTSQKLLMQKMDSIRDRGSSSFVASQSVVDKRKRRLERRREKETPSHRSETAEQREER